MKIDFRINEKPFKETLTYNGLYTLLCLVRIILIMPLIFLCIIYCPIVWLFGINKPIDKCVELWEKFGFNNEN